MDIAMIGAGAMGGLFGGLLTESGETVRLIDVPGPHLTALINTGLLLRTDDRERRLAVRAGQAQDFTGVCELAMVFTKGAHTQTAARDAAHLIGPDTWVLSIQNGLGNDAAIQAAIPTAKIAIGTTIWSADLVAPGHVASHGFGSVRIWSNQPASDEAMRHIAAVLSNAGLFCTADPAVEVAIWEKVAFNAAMNAVSAVSRLDVGGMAGHPSGRALVAALVREALTVAAACRVPVDPDRVARTVDKAFAEHRSHKPSMLQDVLAGRQTEIETINGAIVSRAESLGLDAPVNRTMRDLVRLIT